MLQIQHNFPDVATKTQQLMQQLQTAYDHVKTKASQLRFAKGKADQNAKKQFNPANRQAQAALQSVLDAAKKATDAVEEVVIAASPVAMDEIDGLQQVVMQAVNDTEKASRIATKHIEQARQLFPRVAQAMQAIAAEARVVHTQELSKVTKQLDEAQAKLDKYK